MDSESRVTGNSKNIPIKGHNPEDDHDYTIDNSIEPPRKFFETFLEYRTMETAYDL